MIQEEKVNPRIFELKERFDIGIITEEEKDELIDLINKNHFKKRNWLTRNSMKHQESTKEIMEKLNCEQKEV